MIHNCYLGPPHESLLLLPTLRYPKAKTTCSTGPFLSSILPEVPINISQIVLIGVPHTFIAQFSISGRMCRPEESHNIKANVAMLQEYDGNPFVFCYIGYGDNLYSRIL